MKLFIISFAIILVTDGQLCAQAKDNSQRFAEADARAAELRKQFIFHPELLAEKLSEGLTNDFDKVRAFYTWTAQNIKYDLFAFTHRRSGGQSVNEVLRSGKALCTGYSLLFNYFCENAGIPSVIIEGYAKGFGYQKGQKYAQSNHAWNAVNIYGHWYLLDVTWATGDPAHSGLQRKINLDEHFLVDPEVFILTHLPEDPTWQLLSDKVTLTEFETGKNVNEPPMQSDFSPADYENLNDFDAELLQYKRSALFNPKNIILYERLSFAYVYKAIDIIDRLYLLDWKTLRDSADVVEKEFYAYLDSAQSVMSTVDNSGLKSFKEKLHDEINYQKGIFNYEFGTEIFRKPESAIEDSKRNSAKTGSYFDSAEAYFLSVPESSIYYPSAKEYLSNIRSFRRRDPAASN